MDKKIVQLGHGGGGTMQAELIKFITQGIPIKKIGNGIGLDAYDDGASIPIPHHTLQEGKERGEWEIIVTADGHTVFPLEFPGGDLGKLSVCGTVNDIIMMGGKPLALTSIVLIEEGMEFDLLGKIMNSFNQWSEKADVAILAGDTKVMPQGNLKEMVITTTGIGIKPKERTILDSNCQTGSKIILTGTIGDHGAALIAKREGINLETTLKSDVQLLTPLYSIIEKYEGHIFAMKDPTRGGLSSALNEWAEKSDKGIWLIEEKIPVKKEVQAISDILGLEPMDIANEGKAIICVSNEKSEEILQEIKLLNIGKDAQIIGEIKEEKPKMVIMETSLGGHRIIERPMGEIIPRIC